MGYASVAAANPYGLVALRARKVKYLWSALSILVLASLYVAPLVLVFRQPAIPATVTPLPSLSLPNVAAPILRVPKLHALAP
ncbi:MAG: hypothetical protein JOY72_03775, partial [Actinobacteria bacterium]|nr:hypothetical protein [Actinomycetota bacterium]